MSKQTNIFCVIIACLVLTGVQPAGIQAATPETSGQEHLEALDHEIISISERIPLLRSQMAATRKLQAATGRRIARAKAQELALREKLHHAMAARDRAMRILSEAVQIDYEAKDRGAIELAVTAGSISDGLSRVSYRAAMGDRLDELAGQAKAAESVLQDRKRQLDETISSLELLKQQQDSFVAGLAGQQGELTGLLDSRQDEASYLREELARAAAAQGGILAGVMGGAFQDGQPVRRGDVVGFEGSTGFSTGCHTHFSVIDGGRWADPTRYWRQLSQPPGTIFQQFGMTDWARKGVYGGHIHNGIDFVQGCGNPVRAAADGTVIRDLRGDGSGFGHYVMLRHAGGLVTLYAHLI